MSHRLLVICLLTAIPGIGTAQERAATSTYGSSIDGVIAQVVDGGAWKTIITLVNLDTTVGTYAVKFYGDNGLPLVLETTAGTGSTISGTLAVSASRVIETIGTSLVTLRGWALVDTSNVISGQAIFRQRVAGRPDFEASMPIITYIDSNRYVVPFDHISTATGLALVNPLSYTSITVFLTFRDESGSQFYLASLGLGPLQHTSFSVWDLYPATLGHRGVIEIETSGSALNVLGLRFGPESFTSLLPLTR